MAKGAMKKRYAKAEILPVGPTMGFYTVRDAKAGAYLLPFNAVNHDVAVRNLVNNARQAGSMLGMNPGDYELWYVGEFEELTGRVVETEQVSLGKVIDLLSLYQEGV